MRTQVLHSAGADTLHVATPVTLETIEQATLQLAGARSELRTDMLACNEEVEQVHAKYRDKLKAGASKVAALHQALADLIDSARHLFNKPRTKVFSDIKVGLRKQKGTISWDDADLVVARIKKLLPDQADVLIRTKEEPVKDALSQLSAADLKRLGVTITADSDAVEIKDTASDIDRLVETFLKAEQEKANA